MRESLLSPVLSTAGRRGLLVLTAAVAVVTAATTGGDHRLVQSVVSVPLPLLGVLLAGDVRGEERVHGELGRLFWNRAVAGTLAAVAVAAFAFLACTIVSGTWTPAVAPGCLVVQSVALLIGMGFGLLVRRTWVAMVADAVVPVSLWAAAGAVGLHRAQEWLFPYGAVDDLVSAHAAAVDWVQESVVVVLWVVGLIGLGRLVRQTPERPAFQAGRSARSATEPPPA